MRKSDSLSVSEILFINAYLANGRNGTKAYKQAHPKASLPTSATQASRLLDKPNVAQEIARRIQQDAGVTRDFVQSHLLRALSLAGDSPQAITSVCRELSELAGLKVQKVADVTEEIKKLDPTERQQRVRELLAIPHAEN